MSIDINCRIGYIVFLLSFSMNVFGQDAPFAAWSSVLINTRFHSNWSNTTDLGYRTISHDFTPYQNFIRSGLRYHFNQKISLLGGVAYFNTKTSFLPENHEYGHEFRIYQEIQRLSSRRKKMVFDLRLRNEQRFFSGTSTRDAYHSFRVAGRVLLGYQFTNQFAWHLGSEYFESVTFNKLGSDQVRLITQLVTRMNHGFSLSFMYMYVMRKAYDQSVFNLVLVKNFNFNGRSTPSR